ncbi:MAG: hypothetical protein WAL56_16165 [Candidatus Sulfotelmatobacter sp.]
MSALVQAVVGIIMERNRLVSGGSFRFCFGLVSDAGPSTTYAQNYPKT